MKRFYYQKSILFILLSILVSQNVFAITCAEVYEENLKWDYLKSAIFGTGEILVSTAASLTVVGLIVPAIIIEDELRIHKLTGTNIWTQPQNSKRVIHLLNAASILHRMKESDKNSEESKWAKKKINSFHRQYILAPWPHSLITPKQVSDRLATVNDHGVENGECHELISKKALAERFFQNGKVSIDDHNQKDKDLNSTSSQDDSFQSLLPDEEMTTETKELRVNLK